MTRRGIIASLLLALASRKANAETFVEIIIPDTMDVWETLTDEQIKKCDAEGRLHQDALWICAHQQRSRKPLKYALEVRYKDRVVRLTPEEVMDALEGKPTVTEVWTGGVSLEAREEKDVKGKKP